MVVFDTATVLLAIEPETKAPLIPGTDQRVPNCDLRIQFLLTDLSKRGVRVMVPAPVLAEYLIGCGKNKNYCAQNFISSGNFVVGSFDARAAIDLANLKDYDLDSGKYLDPVLTKAKVKFDRQVIAIAKTEGADTLYTCDTNMQYVAQANGLRVVMTWDLPLPPEEAQGKLFTATSSASESQPPSSRS